MTTRWSAPSPAGAAAASSRLSPPPRSPIQSPRRRTATHAWEREGWRKGGAGGGTARGEGGSVLKGGRVVFSRGRVATPAPRRRRKPTKMGTAATGESGLVLAVSGGWPVAVGQDDDGDDRCGLIRRRETHRRRTEVGSERCHRQTGRRSKRTAVLGVRRTGLAGYPPVRFNRGNSITPYVGACFAHVCVYFCKEHYILL
jgi:hypothetical protein